MLNAHRKEELTLENIKTKRLQLGLESNQNNLENTLISMMETHKTEENAKHMEIEQLKQHIWQHNQPTSRSNQLLQENEQLTQQNAVLTDLLRIKSRGFATYFTQKFMLR